MDDVPEEQPGAGGRAPREPLTRLRISRVLAREKDKLETFSGLAEQIQEAIRGPDGAFPEGEGVPRAVDRRKLKQIIENDPSLVLSLRELRAIDKYLEPMGEGLAYNPLFEKSEVLRCIAESGRVEFMLGSKPDDVERLRINISHWDFLGMNQIESAVRDISRDAHVRVREVRMPETVDEGREALTEPGLRELFGGHGPSIVSLGSARSCLASELMLSRMASLEPGQHHQSGAADELPFRFVWPRDRGFVLPSAFNLYGEDANRDDPAVGEAVLQREAACFRHQGQYLVDELSCKGRSEGNTYALCAVQKREGGQIWLLVAGLTGPATSAAAQWVHKMPSALDDYAQGELSPVFWYLLRAEATRVQEHQRETIRVGEAQVVVGGQAWG